MIRIIGDHLGNNILCSLQCFLRSLYFFFFGNILGRLVKHRFCCLLAQNVFCQRFQPLLLCNTGTGLSLGSIGSVQILYHYQRLSCQNLLLQLVSKLSLFFDALQHLLLFIFQTSQIGQSLIEITQLLVVQRSGDLLTITGDERDGISLIDQLHRSFHLPFFYLKFFFDFLYNIHSSS